MTNINDELQQEIINYAKSKGLLNCKFKSTIHGTIGTFYYGNSNYICELNYISTKNQFDIELKRCKEYIDDFIANLVIQREEESRQPFFILVYIWIRRFIDPGYTYTKKNKNYKELDWKKIEKSKDKKSYTIGKEHGDILSITSYNEVDFDKVYSFRDQDGAFRYALLKNEKYEAIIQVLPNGIIEKMNSDLFSIIPVDFFNNMKVEGVWTKSLNGHLVNIKI